MISLRLVLAILPLCFGRSIYEPYGYPSSYRQGSGQGTAYGTAGAQYGQASSSGNTYTNPRGGSHSGAFGQSSGVGPYSSAVANSASQGEKRGYYKRETGTDLSAIEDEYSPDSEVVFFPATSAVKGLSAPSGIEASFFPGKPSGIPSSNVRVHGSAASSAQNNFGGVFLSSDGTGSTGTESGFSASSTS